MFLIGGDLLYRPNFSRLLLQPGHIVARRVLPSWNANMRLFRAPALLYRFPERPPKFCGIISQRCRPRPGNPTYSFQQWIDVMKNTVLTQFVPTLTSSS